MDKIEEFSGDHRWLSNFWLAPVIHAGFVYPTVENAYQAAKTKPLFRSGYLSCSPGKAKRMGQINPLRKGWDGVKLEVMERLLRQKFQIGTFLAIQLCSTGNREIIEGNTWNDVFWGVCEGAGENNLGKLIMKIRDENMKSSLDSIRGE